MAKSAKYDPLEAAKITPERAEVDKMLLGPTAPLDPTRPSSPAAHGSVQVAGALELETRAAAAPLRTDGPTIEEFIAAGYSAESYPPQGYAERPSSGLTLHKVGSEIPPDLIEQARKPAAPPKRKIYVVQEDGRASVGGGQIALLRRGTEIDFAGYGERGIQRLVDAGIKLKLREE